MMVNNHWLVVTGTMEFDDFTFFGNFIIPTDELIFFFRGVETTNQIKSIYITIYSPSIQRIIFKTVFTGRNWAQPLFGCQENPRAFSGSAQCGAETFQRCRYGRDIFHGTIGTIIYQTRKCMEICFARLDSQSVFGGQRSKMV